MRASKVLDGRVLLCRSGDGYITLDEFIEIMNHNNPEPWTESELADIFAEMDADGGGNVCYEEFAVRWAADRELDRLEEEAEGEATEA